MAEFPSMPLFTDAYLADTRHLTVDEHGAYLLLLMCAWRSPGCALPNDEKKLARMVGVTGRKWKTIWTGIRDLFVIEGEQIFQAKLLESYENLQTKRKANKQNGAKGGRSKSLKTKRRDLANATNSLERNDSENLAYQNHNHIVDNSTVSNTESNSEKESPTSLLSLCPENTRDVEELEFEKFWKVYSRKNDKKQTARKSWQKAIKTAPPAKIISAARAYIASLEPKKRHGPFQAMASTWLNQGCYMDDYEPYEANGVQSRVATGFQG